MLTLFQLSLQGEKDWQKYETARRLKKCVDKIRNQYREDWKSKEMKVRQRAVALYFIDKVRLVPQHTPLTFPVLLGILKNAVLSVPEAELTPVTKVSWDFLVGRLLSPFPSHYLESRAINYCTEHGYFRQHCFSSGKIHSLVPESPSWITGKFVWAFCLQLFQFSSWEFLLVCNLFSLRSQSWGFIIMLIFSPQRRENCSCINAFKAT